MTPSEEINQLDWDTLLAEHRTVSAPADMERKELSTMCQNVRFSAYNWLRTNITCRGGTRDNVKLFLWLTMTQEFCSNTVTGEFFILW